MQKRARVVLASAGVAALLAAGAWAAGAGPEVPFPDGYRHWTFLHSSMVPPTFGDFQKKPCEKPCTSGLYHFYANEQAMQGLKTGTYADGAVFAEEMIEFQSTATGAGKEGNRRVTGVMVRDSKKYAATDGWGYGNFQDGSKTNELDAAGQTACHTCHIAKKDRGYVFTEYKER